MINDCHKGNPTDVTITTYYWCVMDHFIDNTVYSKLCLGLAECVVNNWDSTTFQFYFQYKFQLHQY